jgi:hypothetical protein
MNEYRRLVSGIFAHQVFAESAMSRLIEHGLPKGQLQIFESDSILPVATQQAKSNEVLKAMVIGGAIGAAVGTGIGALAEVALVTADVSLLLASPLLAPLALLGWGASLGGLVGATIGTKVKSGKKEGWFSDLIRDAIANGQVVLVAETLTKQEAAIAREVIKNSVNNYTNLSLAQT